MTTYSFLSTSVDLTVQVTDDGDVSARMDYHFRPIAKDRDCMRAVECVFMQLALDNVNLDAPAFQHAFEAAVETLALNDDERPKGPTLDELSEMLASVDIMGFMRMGAPRDEYLYEARILHTAPRPDLTAVEEVHKVFSETFEGTEFTPDIRQRIVRAGELLQDLCAKYKDRP